MGKKNQVVSCDDDRWRAESDARILADSEEIKSDQKRLDKAIAASRKMAEEKAKELKAMVKISRKGSAPKTPSKKK